jgi:serine/threonine protein kinase
VKPSNILVDGSGLVKVTDFGIAKAAFAGGDVTTTGNLLGTAKYLAPEQVEGGSVDARADLYSTGIVLYEALTGRPPFEAQNHLATATMRLTKAPTPPGTLRPGIPRPLEAVVLKALARRPEDRFQSAEEMSAAIDRATPSVRRPAPPIEVPREPSGGRPSSVFRSWMLVPLLLAVVAAFALVGFFVFGNVFEGGGGSQSTAGQVEPLRIVSVNDYDPLGDGAENGDAVGLATDGNPATSWTTEGYFQADLDKPGVGLLLDLGRQREVTEVRLRTNVPGWSFQVQASESPGGLSDPLPDTEGTSDFVARNAMRIELQPATARYLLIWMTQGADSGDGRYRGDVAEVDLLGPRG